MRDAHSEMKVVAAPPPLGHESLHPPPHGQGHAHRPLPRVRHLHRIVEEDHQAVSREMLEGAFALQDEPAHLPVVLVEHTHDLLGRRRLREGGEAPHVHEDHGDLPAVALERILRASAHDELGELRGEESLEASQALELGHLRAHALLEVAVEIGELGRLGLHGGVEVLDPEEGAHARSQLGHVDGLGEKVVGPGVEPLDALARGVEGGDHDHGEHGVLGIGADPPAHLVAVHPRHHHVEENEIGTLRLDLIEPFLSRGGGDGLVSLRGEQIHEHLHVVRGVVDDEDLLRTHAVTLSPGHPRVKVPTGQAFLTSSEGGC